MPSWEVLFPLLSPEPDFAVVAVVRDGREAMSAVTQHQPHVLITDIEMSRLDGLELSAVVQRDVPAPRF